MPRETAGFTPHEVIMPALGMAQETGLIVSWLKAPGDAVVAGDALFEVETDKATMEVEAPADGFLTDVAAEAGAEVPVGTVIARISDSADGGGQAAPAPVPAEDTPPEAGADVLPEGAGVIMPALGMAQDTGLIVAWLKAPGDAVAAGDTLFEVETDKSTMEVEAGADGYVAALLAEAGEEAPVGEVIAIVSPGKPANPIRRGLAAKGAAPAAAKPEPAAAPEPAPAAKQGPKAAPARNAAPPAAAAGRILASPKARRLALEQGLDLARLVQAGHPQPYHVSDLEVLRGLADPAAAGAAAGTGQALHLTAEVPAAPFAEFLDWITRETGAPPDRGAVLAAFAAAALRQAAPREILNVVVEGPGGRRLFADPDLGGLGAAADADDPTAPGLLLRDLVGSALTSLRLGAEAQPVLSVTGTQTLAITLECAPGQLSGQTALDLMTGLAGRLSEPLRHLL